MSKYKTDYIALQNLWYDCSKNYLEAAFRGDKNSCMLIIDAFRSSLVDITPFDEKEIDDNSQAIRHIYLKWEKEEWIPFCKAKLLGWARRNGFESNVEENKLQEFENIKMDYNYMRYEKIMQVIQDSGIGLGQGNKNINEYFVSQE